MPLSLPYLPPKYPICNLVCGHLHGFPRHLFCSQSARLYHWIVTVIIIIIIIVIIRRKTRRVKAGGKNSEPQRVKMSRHLKDEMFQCEIMIGQVLIISYIEWLAKQHQMLQCEIMNGHMVSYVLIIGYIEWLAKQHHYQLPTSQVVNPIPYIVNGNDNISTKDNVALDQY